MNTMLQTKRFIIFFKHFPIFLFKLLDPVLRKTCPNPATGQHSTEPHFLAEAQLHVIGYDLFTGESPLCPIRKTILLLIKALGIP